MSVPATLQDFRPEKDFSLLGVPNRMATDFVGLRAEGVMGSTPPPKL